MTPTSIDLHRIGRIEDWLLDLPAPAYPYPVNEELAAKGKPVYDRNCAQCHAFDGAYTGKVSPIDEIGTDRERLDSYTYELNENQNTLYAGYEWRFSHFRKTNGYANMPLDGVWLRAPYLHNGSVPTMADLLEPAEKRPKEFYRGYDVYDPARLGFFTDVKEENGISVFLFRHEAAGQRQQRPYIRDRAFARRQTGVDRISQEVSKEARREE